MIGSWDYIGSGYKLDSRSSSISTFKREEVKKECKESENEKNDATTERLNDVVVVVML